VSQIAAALNRMILTVAIYLRVSTEEQRLSGYSLPEQRLACMQKVREVAPGATVIEYLDDLSGMIIEGREKLDALREAARSGGIDIVVCLHPDRFARNLAGQLLVYEELQKAGCKVVFSQVHFEDSPEGTLFLQMSGAIAQYEKAKIRERTVRGRNGKVRQGGIATWIFAYGYDWDSETDQLSINEEEAAWVRRIFQWAAGVDGSTLGTQQIAARLNELGVPTKRAAGKTRRATSGRWHRSTLKNILRNTLYIGRLVQHRVDQEGLDAWRRVPRHKRPVVRGLDGIEKPLAITPRQRPRADWVVTPVPAIIDEGLWVQVQTMLDRGKRTSQKAEHLLSGLVECGLCHSPVHIAATPKYQWLRCRGRYPRYMDYANWEERPRCALPYLPMAPIEAQVWGEVREWVLHPEVLDRKRAEVEARSGEGAARQDLAAQIAMVGHQLKEQKSAQGRIVALVAMGSVHPEVADQQLRPIQERILHLQAELERLQARADIQPERPPAANDTDQAWRAQIASQLEQLENHSVWRRELLRRMVRRIIVSPDGTAEVIPL